MPSDQQPHDDREQYEAPEIERVGDAQELTLGETEPVTDRPDKGYYDAANDPTGPQGPRLRQLDV